jgi:hypothetical protein
MQFFLKVEKIYYLSCMNLEIISAPAQFERASIDPELSFCESRLRSLLELKGEA